MVCRRRALASADRPRLVGEVAAALQRGELCVLPTETVYGLALLPSSAPALERARRLKGRAVGHEFTLHLANAADAASLAVTTDPRGERLRQRYWPGPLTLVLPAPTGGTVGLRVPAHAFTRDVIAAVGEPLWLTSVNRTGEPPLCDPAAIEAAFGAELAILVDDGPSSLGTASTVVRCTGPELEVLREGILSAAEVLATAAQLVLFVCTGNTCRSPLAEVQARRALARSLGVAPDRLPARGIAFASAGTGTLDGMPASDGSLTVAGEQGLDLSQHRSQELTPDLARRAARIHCLSQSHLDAVLELAPDVAAKADLLRKDAQGIADPYGGPLAIYRRTSKEIEAAIAQRIDEWRALLPSG